MIPYIELQMTNRAQQTKYLDFGILNLKTNRSMLGGGEGENNSRTR